MIIIIIIIIDFSCQIDAGHNVGIPRRIIHCVSK